MSPVYIIGGIAIMALMTYIIRVTPMVVFREKIENKRIRSFLYYVLYTVMTAMTFPAIFESTGSTLSAVVGCAVAVVLAYRKKGLLVVALGAAVSAYAVSFLMRLCC
jgi:branched-subunit amino acid transport protein